MIEGKTERYELGRPIGSGGMATVHLARRQRDGALIAIKRLHPHLLADPGIVRRFREESTIAARVKSPNVVPVHEVIDVAEGPMLVLEYVEGESLMNLLYACWNRGDIVPLPIASAIATDLLTALEAAHGAVDEGGAPAPVIHRDVSPHNVLVGFDGVAKLSDFGIARVGQAGSTQEGQLKGKLGYLAPELLGGQKVGPRSDIYGAGVVLWELLAGQKMLEGSTAEILSQILGGERAPPSAHCDGIPSELDATVMRALATDPSKRFGSARTMADALGAAVAPASRAEVGAWVRELAGQAVALRSLRGPEDDALPPSSAAPTRILSRFPVGSKRRTVSRGWLVIGAVVAVGLVGVGAFSLGTRLREDGGARSNEPSIPSAAAAGVAPGAAAASAELSPSSLEDRLSRSTSEPGASSSSALLAPNMRSSAQQRPAVASVQAPASPNSSASRATAFDRGLADKLVRGQSQWIQKNCPALPSGEMWIGIVHFKNDGSVSVTRTSRLPSVCVEGRLAGLKGPSFDGAEEDIGTSFFWPIQ